MIIHIYFKIVKASLLKELNHKNIVSYVESFKEDDLLIIIMEYCQRKKIQCEQPDLQIVFLQIRWGFGISY